MLRDFGCTFSFIAVSDRGPATDGGQSVGSRTSERTPPQGLTAGDDQDEDRHGPEHTPPQSSIGGGSIDNAALDDAPGSDADADADAALLQARTPNGRGDGEDEDADDDDFDANVTTGGGIRSRPLPLAEADARVHAATHRLYEEAVRSRTKKMALAAARDPTCTFSP